MNWESGKPYLEEITKGVYAYIQPDGSWMINNTGFVVGPRNHTLLVDTSSTEKRTKSFLSEVAAVAPEDPKALVNTHHHPDHTYGNCFAPASTTVIAHDKCRPAMIAAGLEATKVLTAPDYGDLEVRPPDITFTTDLTYWLGGDRAVELHFVGPAHTTNDVIVWLPDSKTLFAGDILFAGGQPFLLEGSLQGFPKALKVIRDLAPEVVVPGHGPVQRGEQAEQLLTNIESYVEYVDQVSREGHAAGWSALETARRNEDNPYAGWHEPERFVGNIMRAYSELDGNPLDTVIKVPQAWPDMEKFVGHEIPCHA